LNRDQIVSTLEKQLEQLAADDPGLDDAARRAERPHTSCRNRHCPKCQGAVAKEWLAEREAELLPVGYFHVVFTLPGPIADIASQNKAVIYDRLFKAAAETELTDRPLPTG
jgi:hypothetical protein